MKRYRHHWWAERGRYFPPRIAVANCTTAVSERGRGRRGKGAPRPVQWAVSSAELTRGEVRSTRLTEGKGAGSLWAFLAHFAKSRETTWIFAPNCIQFLDDTGFWTLLEEREVIPAGTDWRTERGTGHTGEDRPDGLFVLDGPPIVISCRPRDAEGKWLILDTRNLGFELLGDDYGCSGQCERYLSGILSCLRTLRATSAASFRCTAASQAVSCLRADWDVSSLHCHTDSRASRLERGSALYGHCQAYRKGYIAGPVYHLDVRSMYASIYRTLPVPVSLRRYVDAERTDGACQPGDAAHCIAHVRYASGRAGEGLGDRRSADDADSDSGSFLAGPELDRGMRDGRVSALLSWAEYTCRPVLSGYADQWLDQLATERQAGDQLTCQWIKRLLVAVVGKFAETGKRWIGVPRVSDRGSYGQWYGTDPQGRECLYRNIAGWTQRREVYGESYHSIPAITAFITAAGRCQLSDYRECAGRSNVYYVDTDALICGQEGYSKLLSAGHVRDGEVGHLRLLGVHSACIIHDERHYELDATIKCSGVPRGKIGPGQTRREWWQGPNAGEGVHRPIWKREGGQER